MKTLEQFLNDAGETQHGFAARIGVKQSTVSKMLNGLAEPSIETAVKIETATGGAVPVASWPKFARVAQHIGQAHVTHPPQHQAAPQKKSAGGAA